MRSQLRKLVSLDDFNRQRGVAMSITVTISAVQSHTPDVNADDHETSNSRRSPSLILISVGADHPCCRKLHGSPRSFLPTGTNFLSIRSHLLIFSRADHSTSQVLTTSHVVFISTFTEGLLQKPPCIHQTSSDWSNCCDVIRRGY